MGRVVNIFLLRRLDFPDEYLIGAKPCQGQNARTDAASISCIVKELTTVSDRRSRTATPSSETGTRQIPSHTVRSQRWLPRCIWQTF